MSTTTKNLDGIAFLSFPQQSELLKSELKSRFGILDKPSEIYGDLLYFENAEKIKSFLKGEYPYWARTVMVSPFILNFDSIGDAASALKQIQRNWAPYQFCCFRRAELIQEKLPYINLKDKKFPFEIPDSEIGLYTLLDEHTLIASSLTTSNLPAGTIRFIEDHENPPSRAYLKIQESLLLSRHFLKTKLPESGTKCFEAGACPGGWTWVLAGLGANVFAVDRAELVPQLMQNPLVKFAAHDAFTYKPEEIGPFDWVFSDVICYPERLLEWIKKWIDSKMTKNMICTIKMQGEINWELIKEFAAISNSKIVHLNYNKHELTWMWTSKES